MKSRARFQTSMASRALALSSLIAASCASAPAAAQDIAAAEALFNSGLFDMKAGRYETGCKALAESQRLDPRPGTLFTLANCEARWGRIATAVTRFGDFVALYERLPSNKTAAQAERYKQAKLQRDKLAPDVPQLTLSLPVDAPAGTVVKRGGDMMASAALGVSLPVDPGEYTITTQAPNGPVWETRITITKGEKKQVALEVRPPRVEAPPAPPPPSSTGPSTRRVATYAIGGAGAVGVVVGAILGGLAVARKGVMNEHCGTAIGVKDATACDPTGLTAANDLKAFGLGSSIALPVGAAALGAAVVLFVTEPKAATPKAGMGAHWISAGVISVGPGEALIGAQGIW